MDPQQKVKVVIEVSVDLSDAFREELQSFLDDFYSGEARIVTDS